MEVGEVDVVTLAGGKICGMWSVECGVRIVLRCSLLFLGIHRLKAYLTPHSTFHTPQNFPFPHIIRLYQQDGLIGRDSEGSHDETALSVQFRIRLQLQGFPLMLNHQSAFLLIRKAIDGKTLHPFPFFGVII
jgi:hypothetical protein